MEHDRANIAGKVLPVTNILKLTLGGVNIGELPNTIYSLSL